MTATPATTGSTDVAAEATAITASGIEAAADTPPFVQPAPPPGWTSSEFIATCIVHLLNLLAVLLDLVHVDWDKGLSSLQGIIPIAALALSSALQALYQNHRTQLKVAHITETAKVKVEQIKAIGPTLLPALAAAEGLVTDPEVKSRLSSIESAVTRLEKAWSAGPDVVNNRVIVTTGMSESADVTATVSDPTQQNLVGADPTVSIAPVVPGDQLADAGTSGQDLTAGAPSDPTASAADPTAGGLYLDPSSDEARAQLASGPPTP